MLESCFMEKDQSISTRKRRAWWRCWSHRAEHMSDMPATREAEARGLQLKASLGNSVGLAIPLPLGKKGWGLALECPPGMDEVLGSVPH